jgi:hypothetical protein
MDFKKVTKFCLQCNKKLQLRSTRDILRKNFCSRICSSFFHGKKRDMHLVACKGNKHPSWKGGITKITNCCKECGKSIIYNSINKLCRTCFNHGKKKDPVLVNLVCKGCGMNFIRIKAQVKDINNSYCCKSCCKSHNLLFRPHINKIEYICPNCQLSFHRYASLTHGKLTFCSHKCNASYYAKINRKTHNFYIDGRTELRRLIRTSSIYDEWKETILNKARYQCSQCKKKSRLHVHHIESFSNLITKFLNQNKNLRVGTDKEKLLELASDKNSIFWDVNNGKVLCRNCHSELHPNLKKILVKNPNTACEYCKIDFYKESLLIRNDKHNFCSIFCYNQFRKRKMIKGICYTCNKPIIRKNNYLQSSVMFCSKQCLLPYINTKRLTKMNGT